MRAARTLNRRARRQKPLWRSLARPLPPLLFFTDPQRTPDALALAARLPRGCGVVLRLFGAADSLAQAQAFARLAKRRGLILLIGADAALARRAGAAGVHLPQRAAGQAGRLRLEHPDWIITAAAHDLAAARRALRAGADAAVASPVFASNSPSAGRPLGVETLGRWIRSAGGPIYALGGIDGGNAQRLIRTGIVGVAAVDAVAQGLRAREAVRT